MQGIEVRVRSAETSARRIKHTIRTRGLRALNPKLLPDPLISNHTNIGRTHEILADYFYTMICQYEFDLVSQFAQKNIPYLDAYGIPPA